GAFVLSVGTMSDISLLAPVVKAAGANRVELGGVRLSAGCVVPGALVLPVVVIFAAVMFVFALVFVLAVVVSAAGAGTKVGGSGSMRFGSGGGSCTEAFVGNWRALASWSSRSASMTSASSDWLAGDES